MINIYSVKLLDILPPNLREDPDIIAVSQATDTEFLLLVKGIENCVVLPNIDNITDSNLIDLLAWELHVDFYDPSLPLEKRREIVKNSIKWHMQKGTSAVVEELIGAAFDECSVQEWFEYGGQPYMFKVTTTDRITSTEKLTELIRAVRSVKNTRSWLEAIYIERDNNLDLYTGAAAHIGRDISLKTDGIKIQYESLQNHYIGKAIHTGRTTALSTEKIVFNCEGLLNPIAGISIHIGRSITILQEVYNGAI